MTLEPTLINLYTMQTSNVNGLGLAFKRKLSDSEWNRNNCCPSFSACSAVCGRLPSRTRPTHGRNCTSGRHRQVTTPLSPVGKPTPYPRRSTIMPAISSGSTHRAFCQALLSRETVCRQRLKDDRLADPSSVQRNRPQTDRRLHDDPQGAYAAHAETYCRNHFHL